MGENSMSSSLKTDNSHAMYSDAEAVFREACDSFRQNLPVNQKSEFREYTNAQSMIADIQNTADNHPVHKSKLTIVVGKLNRFANRIQPYFDIVNIFVQAKPEYAALVWGSLRTIFQLASNYITFLDKISDMFVRLSGALPAYEEYVTILQQRAQSRGDGYPGLAKALSYLYLDILRFCHNICLLFSRKRKGLKLKTTFIGRLTLTPVSVQFSDILSKLEEHKTLLDLQISNASTQEALKFYVKMEEKLLKDDKSATEPNGHLTESERQEIEKKFRNLRGWINPPKWADKLEEAQGKRASGTASWILGDAKLQNLQSQVCNTGPSLGKRTLSIQAKPGFGKTVLFAAVIEYLGQCALTQNDMAEEMSPSVLFYFFDQRRGDFNSASDAFRAMLTQVISLHRYNDALLRTANASLESSNSGEETATDKEIESLLSLLLSQVEISFLAFDGLDECSDHDRLFKGLAQICSESIKCGLLFSGRPSIQLPRFLSKNAETMKLTSQENKADIESYLLSQIEELFHEELFSPDLATEEIVRLISPRANGMFLWVKLLLEYLRLPTLTSHERQDAVMNINRLEGLDALYEKILCTLERRLPRSSHARLQTIFQWVAHARRPLLAKELQVAVCVPLDRRQSVDDMIPNFEKNLGPLTGSLIEMTPGGNVQFIHLSAYEFFCGPSMENDPHLPVSKYASYLAGADCSMASTCVSYLYYTVPAGPLSGSSGATALAGPTSSIYPLLEYSAGYWSTHFGNSLKDIQTSSSELSFSDSSWKVLSGLINAFVADEKRITMWIEAAWLFDSPPFIPDPRLDADSALWYSLTTNVSATPLAQAIKTVYELSRDVAILNRDWQHVLKQEPNEIWEPSIPSFTKSRFWVGTTASRLTLLAPVKDSTEQMTIQSQISDSGSEIGVIRLAVPREWRRMDFEKYSHQIDWTVHYELRSILGGHILSSVDVVLPAKKFLPLLAVAHALQSDSDSKPKPEKETLGQKDKATEDNQISLPVAISSDLRRALIFDTVVQLSSPPPYQKAVSKNTPIILRQILDVSSKSNYKPFRNDVGFDPSSYEIPFEAKFSSSGKYLVLVRESVKKASKSETQSYGERWWMQVLGDKNFESSTGPEYTCIASSIFFAVPEIGFLSPSRGVAFHPSLPRLAFPQVFEGLPQTWIWDFDKPVVQDQHGILRSNPFPINDPPIVDVYFTDDGEYLCGTDTPLEYGFEDVLLQELCNPIIVKASEPVIKEKLLSSDLDMLRLNRELQPWDLKSNASSPFQPRALSLSIASELAKKPKPPVQRTNCLVVEKGSGGVVHISQLQKLEEQGAVMLRKFSADGKFQAETLTRLPDAVRKCVDVSLIHPIHEASDTTLQPSADRVYVVLNKQHQRFYTVGDIDENVLPAIIEREKESIPTFVNSVPLRQHMGRGVMGYCRKQSITLKI